MRYPLPGLDDIEEEDTSLDEEEEKGHMEEEFKENVPPKLSFDEE